MAGDRIQGMSIDMQMESSSISRSMSEIKRSMKGLNSEAKVTSNNFKFGKKDTDAYKKAIDSLSDTTQKQRKNVEDLGKRYAQTVEEQGASSKAAQNLATEYNKQADNLNRLENELGGMEQELAKLTEEQRIAESQWTKTGQAMEKQGARMQRVGGGMQKVGGIFTAMSAAVVGGVAGAAGGLFSLTNKATEAADGIAKGAEKIGTTTDFYQEMDYWASQNGLSQDNMEKAIGRLNQRMGLAIEGNDKYATALTTLGVDLDGVKDGTVSTEDAMAQSITTLSEMENEHEKAALATELFGTKMSRELMPALNDGSLTMEDARKKAEELGLVMGQDQLEAAEAFQDAKDDITRSMGAIGMKIGLDLMPHFQKMLDWVKSNLPAIRESITTAFNSAVESVKNLIDWWTELSGTTQKLLIGFGAFTLALGPVLLVVGKVVSVMGGLMTVLGPVLTSIAKAGGLIKWLAPLFGVLTSPITLTVAAIAALGAGFVIAYNKSETFRNFIDGLREKFSKAIEWIGQFKDGIIGLFKDDGMEGMDILTSIGLSQGMAQKLWDITGYFIEFKWKIVEIVDNVKGVFQGILDFFQGDLAGGIDILRSIGLSDETIEKIYTIVQRIQYNFYVMRDKIQLALAAVGNFFKSIFSDIKSWWDENGTMIVAAVLTIFNHMREKVFGTMTLIGGIIKTTINVIVEIFRTFQPIVMGIWNLLWPIMLTVLKNVWSKIQLVIGVATDLITGIIAGFAAIVQGDWGRLWEILRSTAASIKDRIVTHIDQMRANAIALIQRLAGGAIEWFQNMRSNLTTKATNLKDRVVLMFEILRSMAISKIVDLVGTVGRWFIDLYNNVRTRVTNLKNSAVNLFTQLRNGAVNIVLNLRDRMVRGFTRIYNAIKSKVTSARDIAIRLFNNLRDRAASIVSGLRDRIFNLFTRISNSIRDKMRSAKDWAIDAAQSMWTGVTDFFSDIWSDATDLFDNMVDAAKELPSRIGDAISGAASFAVDGVKSMGNKMGEKLGGVVNGVTGGLNDVLGKIGVDDLIPEISIPTFSTGTSGGAIANNMLGILNDKGPGNGSGGATQELIERNGSLLAPQGKNAMVPLEKGDRIYNGAETQSLMSSGLIPHFSKGTGKKGKGETNEKKGLFGTIGDVLKNTWDYIKNPGKAFQAVIDNVGVDFSGLSGFGSKMAKGGFGMIKDKALGWLKGIFKDNEGGQVSGGSILNRAITASFGRYPANIARQLGISKHYGLDTAHRYEPLKSPISGKVDKVWNDYGGGNSIQIRSGDLTWWFMHMKSIAKKVGDAVKVGSLLGTTGNTGNNTTGYHLHTQAMEGGVGNRFAIDPEPILKNNGFATGGFVNNGLYRLGEEGHGEWIIPTDPRRATEAMKLLALAGKDVQGNKRPGQLPNPASGTAINNSNWVEGKLDKLIELLTLLLASNQNLENKELIIQVKELIKAQNKYKDDRAMI